MTRAFTSDGPAHEDGHSFGTGHDPPAAPDHGRPAPWQEIALAAAGRPPPAGAAGQGEAVPTAPAGARVHRGPAADEATHALDAAAVTVGSDIAVHSDADDLSSPQGQALLSHELEHVAQQSRAADGARPALGSVGDPWERAANAAAHGEAVAAPETGVPVVQRQNWSGRATYGEQTMAFTHYRLEDGWAALRGPSGAGGHPWNAPGEDGLFYNVRNNTLRIADNKAYANPIGTATAIDPETNLLQNLDSMIADVAALPQEDAALRNAVLPLLQQTRAAVANGTPIPANVELMVHVEAGGANALSGRLQAAGVRITTRADPVVVPAGTTRPPFGTDAAAAAEARAGGELRLAADEGPTATGSVPASAEPASAAISEGIADEVAVAEVGAAEAATWAEFGGFVARSLGEGILIGMAIEAAVHGVPNLVGHLLGGKDNKPPTDPLLEQVDTALRTELTRSWPAAVRLTTEDPTVPVYANVTLEVAGEWDVRRPAEVDFGDVKLYSLGVERRRIESGQALIESTAQPVLAKPMRRRGSWFVFRSFELSFGETPEHHRQRELAYEARRIATSGRSVRDVVEHSHWAPPSPRQLIQDAESERQGRATGAEKREDTERIQVVEAYIAQIWDKPGYEEQYSEALRYLAELKARAGRGARAAPVSLSAHSLSPSELKALEQFMPK